MDDNKLQGEYNVVDFVKIVDVIALILSVIAWISYFVVRLISGSIYDRFQSAYSYGNRVGWTDSAWESFNKIDDKLNRWLSIRSIVYGVAIIAVILTVVLAVLLIRMKKQSLVIDSGSISGCDILGRRMSITLDMLGYYKIAAGKTIVIEVARRKYYFVGLSNVENMYFSIQDLRK